MVKIDAQATRTPAFADDEAMEQFYRPAAASGTHGKTQQENASERSSRQSAKPVSVKPAGGAEDDDEEGFLRARRRVPVRRGWVPASRVGRIAAAAGLLLSIGCLFVLGMWIRNFFRDDPRFRIASASSIQIMGNSMVTRSELLSVFGSDVGRNIFLIPLRQRRAALEQLPWVEHATVMRLLPDQLRIAVIERTPIAFVRHSSTIGLIDAHGVLLHQSPAAMAAQHYSFPVVTGISAKDPLPVRAARMRLYQQFIHDLDSGGTKVSSQLSEVDLSDAEDVWALLPAQGSDIQVHFGDTDFLARYRSYQQHLPQWKQQYPHLASVDMRYENQAVLDMAPPSSGVMGSSVMGSSQTGSGVTAQDGEAASPSPASNSKHTGHTAAKPVAKSLKAGRAKGQ